MKSISGRKMCAMLVAHGWTLNRIRGSHHIFTKPGVTAIITVPVHGAQDLRLGTLRKILRDAGLSEHDL